MADKMVLIKFYVPEKLKLFLKEFARENGMEMSELIRNSLIYFHMAYLLGKLTEPMPVLKKEFMERFGNNKKNKDK